ncbi:T9SS type A sorting domain-containing protein [Neolewinella aurantiaca]|uniref:T9SS type A sorting domain-containing protein n=1 Tax=Neolewinella aurantiaca TaxID=2602767 RepID=A0A5C7FLT8_9BACT|nr:T9SS type A sorting domain-containing protein [Neolewinella aurantiaca]TXF87049.1 T9SS type A sorting domain-containing protein [Neolewinella aurantiaca]
MKTRITTFLLLAACLVSTPILAQCPSGGGPVCYSGTSSRIPIAVDLCPATGQAIEVTITAGEVENNSDELMAYYGPAGSGTDGTLIYESYGTAGNLTGLVLTAPVADQCISIYVNSNFSNTCADQGYTPISFTTTCYTPSCLNTIIACYENFNPGTSELVEICPEPGFSQVDIEFMQGEIEEEYDELDIYSGPSGSIASGTQLANDLDGDLTGLTFSSVASGDCIILVVSSDASVECNSDTRIEEMVICVANSMPLPVTLSEFSAVPGKGSNIIHWVTSLEENTEKYQVERSNDGVSDWHIISEVAAIGFSSSPQEYSSMDDAPYTNSFYRLRSIDFDGHSQLSEIIQVVREGGDFDFVRVFPVPTEDQLTVEYETEKEKAVTVSVHNYAGQLVHQQKMTAVDGLNKIRLNVVGLPKGVYFLNIDDGNRQIVQRIIK